jgi:hypothetical protein
MPRDFYNNTLCCMSLSSDYCALLLIIFVLCEVIRFLLSCTVCNAWDVNII